MALVELSYAVRLRLVHTQAQFRSRLCRLLLFSLLLLLNKYDLLLLLPHSSIRKTCCCCSVNMAY